jgi:modification methylase
MIQKYLNTILCGDVLEKLSKFPSQCIDLVITSPPYNLKNSSGNGMKYFCKGTRWENAALINGYDCYDDNMPHQEYVEWQRQVLTECMRVIKDTGAIFYNHKWRVQNGLMQIR